MSEKSITGVIDEPLYRTPDHGDNDQLKLDGYYRALANFIKQTPTPMTIGVQGEWGTGKTTLLNRLWEQLHGYKENQSDATYVNIWVNAWEHTLMAIPEMALINIIKHISTQVQKSDPDTANELQKKVKAFGAGVLQFAAAYAGGVGAKQTVDELLNDTATSSVKELRSSLQACVKSAVATKNNSVEKFVIYIDDLDRLEPRVAVQILELLKNIFNLEHCVFVLAIDFEVVEKGLRAKYGEKFVDNQSEHQSFFEKIIQTTFRMPLAVQGIEGYVKKLLEDIRFSDSFDDHFPEGKVKDVLDYTIGGNPRSIKRMVNSLSLINLLRKEGLRPKLFDEKNDYELFAFVCLQTAYPKFYELLQKRPQFNQWDENFAREETQKKEEQIEGFNEIFQGIIDNEDLEEWERALFRICFASDELRPHATRISKFLNLFETISTGEIQGLIETTTVTSVRPTARDDVKSLEDRDWSTELWATIIREIRSTSGYFNKETKSTSAAIPKTSNKNSRASFVIEQKEPLIMLKLQSNDFESLKNKKDVIETDLQLKEGLELTWRPRSGKNKCQIRLRNPELSEKIKKNIELWCQKNPEKKRRVTPQDSDWPEITQFFRDNIEKFESVLDRYIGRPNE